MKKTSYRLLAASLALILAALACINIPRLPRLEEVLPQPTQQRGEPYELPTTRAPETPPQIFVPDYSSLEGSLEALYQKVSPGVVSIQVSTNQGAGQGSGFVIDKQGHIVTNYHVAGNAQSLEVHFPSGLKVYGDVIAEDIDSDLAVIKVDVPEDQLFPLVLGDSDLAAVGSTVVAIGNPYGLSGTMTSGIISASGRTLQSLRTTETGSALSAGDLIQTDCNINPGNSGGPLLNLAGEVIGVNRAIRTAGTSITGEAVNTGIGFAISSNIVRRVVPYLIENGTYEYPYLGLSSMNSLSLAAADELGLTQSTGAYVMDVVPNGPAAKAGILAGTRQTRIQGLYAGGDLIVAADGREIKEFDGLLSYLMLNKMPGDVVTLTVIRDGRTAAISAYLKHDYSRPKGRLFFYLQYPI